MSEMNENKKLSCAVARDLMPLYVENLTEEETTVLMREHIGECAACAQSYGMQKTKLEIEKKPQRPDFRGVRFFKKSFLKRVALWMAVAIMSFVIVVGGYYYLFTNRTIEADLVKVVGQYELTDGRIVLALQADGYCVNNLEFFSNTYVDYAYYDYSQSYRQIRTDEDVWINASVGFITDRFKTWTQKEDERGSIFYYMFDPEKIILGEDEVAAFRTQAPTANDTAAEEQSEITLVLRRVRAEGAKTLWQEGDPLRKLTKEEEEVLLRAMEKAGFLDSSALLPEVDIIDTLMGK